MTEQTDAPDDEDVDCGMEWPLSENRDVARYRKFYQVWTNRIFNSRNISGQLTV